MARRHRDVAHDGLGFGFKWNMGWMNDSLRYYGYDPINRQHHHDEMTFAMSYAYWRTSSCRSATTRSCMGRVDV